MFTVVETPTFSRLWPDYWTEDIQWRERYSRVGRLPQSPLVAQRRR